MGLDELLPEYVARERHERVVDLSAERALAAALEAPLDRVTRALFALRGLPSARSHAELFRSMRFEELERGETELVVGAAGTPWRPTGGIRPIEQAAQGTVRMALAVGARPLADGRSLLWTETRVAATDDRARRAFRRYWRVVGPFSGLVRRRWLRSVSRL